MKLKMYVWENVLPDYTYGMVCAIAESEEQAWELLKAKDPWAYGSICKGRYPDQKITQPVEVTNPDIFIVAGGG